METNLTLTRLEDDPLATCNINDNTGSSVVCANERNYLGFCLSWKRSLQQFAFAISMWLYSCEWTNSLESLMVNNYIYIAKYGNKRGNVSQLNIQSFKKFTKKYVIFTSNKFHRRADVFSIFREILTSLIYTNIILYEFHNVSDKGRLNKKFHISTSTSKSHFVIFTWFSTTSTALTTRSFSKPPVMHNMWKMAMHFAKLYTLINYFYN